MSNEIITVLCNYSVDRNLIDRRMNRYGSSLGSISTLSKQYGVEITKRGEYVFYSAPKRRMQMFIQNLHFANVSYTII